MQTAQRLFARLTEVEKIQLRAAGPDRLAYLADTSFRSDLPDTSHAERTLVVEEAASMCLLEFAVKGGTSDFGQVTWKF